MNIVLIALVCSVVGLTAAQYMGVCSKDPPQSCQLPYCQCSLPTPPIQGYIPQFVMLSFDDTPDDHILEGYWEPLLFHLKNPDGCPVSGTFFVPHDYTDYVVVNRLYNQGFEIGSHSVTKNWSDYWKSATNETIIREMDGQRQIISHFANIPMEDITGVRIPHLEINHVTFQALADAGFDYDSSWTTERQKPLFPYTLDWSSRQECISNKDCHSTPVPGFWILPIIDYVSQDQYPCNELMSCAPNGTTVEIFEWLKQNFLSVYNYHRAPFTLRPSYAWTEIRRENKLALKWFLDYLTSLQDVFIVSQRQVLEWAKNPTNYFSSCKDKPIARCDRLICRLFKNGIEERYLSMCYNKDRCPKTYPWLDNLLGN